MPKSTSFDTSCTSSSSSSSSCSTKSSCKPIKKLTVRRINANKINCKNLSVHNNAFIKDDVCVGGNLDVQRNLIVHNEERIKKKLTIGDTVVNLDDNVGLVVDKKAIFNDTVQVNGRLTTHGLQVLGVTNNVVQVNITDGQIQLNNVPDFDNPNIVRSGTVRVDVYGYLRLVP